MFLNAFVTPSFAKRQGVYVRHQIGQVPGTPARPMGHAGWAVVVGSETNSRFVRDLNGFWLVQGARPPLPIYMKGHGWLRASNRTKSIQLIHFAFNANTNTS